MKFSGRGGRITRTKRTETRRDVRCAVGQTTGPSLSETVPQAAGGVLLPALACLCSLCTRRRARTAVLSSDGSCALSGASPAAGRDDQQRRGTGRMALVLVPLLFDFLRVVFYGVFWWPLSGRMHRRSLPSAAAGLCFVSEALSFSLSCSFSSLLFSSCLLSSLLSWSAQRTYSSWSTLALSAACWPSAT